MPTLMNINDFRSILRSARGSNEPCSPVLKALLGPNGPKNHPRGPPRVPQDPTSHPETSTFFHFGWCSDDICHAIFDRDSLAAFQASQDQTQIVIVAPSFQSIRLHISQAEYPEPPNTFERKRDSGSFFQARWRSWPAGQLDIYIYIYIHCMHSCERY